MNNSELQELLPCPFCGGNSQLWMDLSDVDGCEIICDDCGGASGHYTDKTGAQAVEAWNRRAQIKTNEDKND